MANDRHDVLEEFYKRIAARVKSKGGTSTRIMVRRTDTVRHETPKVEGIPGLLAKMPSDFEVEFAPEYALSTPGDRVDVRATRRRRGAVKDSQYVFSFGSDGQWRYYSQPVTDENIDACLTLTGPPVREN
jgi:hypothetical protein